MDIYHALARIHHWLLATQSKRIWEVYISRIVYVMLQCACSREINGPDFHSGLDLSGTVASAYK